MRFKIDWASHIVGSKFTVFALFYFIFGDNFPSRSPRGAYIWRGDLTEGFLPCRFGGLIFGGAYTWRGLFSEFYGISSHLLMDRKGIFVACVSCASHCKMIVIMFYYYCVALYILCMSTVALCIVFNFSSGLLLEARKRLQRKWKLLL